MPNEKFRVQVIDEKGVQQVKSWVEVENQPDLWITEIQQPQPQSEDFLIKKDDGSSIYYNEGALWRSQSHYRIEGNKLTPISFLFFSIGTVFFAMVLASTTYAIVKYGFKRWLYRHLKEQTQVYNKAVLKSLKFFLL